jgi:HD-GYP domain-containing protein (c-di-GMP phosphodiesterase class II)
MMLYLPLVFYKRAFTPEQALSMMVKNKGSHFDIILLKIFIGYRCHFCWYIIHM